MKTAEVKFKKWECKALISEYTRGGKAIQLVDEEGPVATATIWIDGLAEDELAIKDYSENEGMLDCLLESGLVEKPHRWEFVGFARVPVTRLKNG